MNHSDKLMPPAAGRGPGIAILIPAYRPQAILLDICRSVLEDSEFDLVVVDDGSGPDCRHIFDEIASLPRTQLVRHAVNLGKGAALKTGMNQALTTFSELIGVVTADADGQHHVEDIRRVAHHLKRSPGNLILGVRSFGSDVPLRNRFGNVLTRNLVHLLMGQRLSDTQTGLRGIPRAMMERLLRVPSQGYEFELDMLTAAKHHGVPVEEEPIRTIYDHPDRASHFNPIRDSMKIYFVLLRFGFVSLLTAALDNIVFILVFRIYGSLAGAQLVSRTIALLFNYAAARSAVFFSRERHAMVFPKYLLLVAANGLVSYGLISFLAARFSLPVVWAKLIAETILFLANFAIQRDFVFTKSASRASATDWTRYYTAVPPTAKLTRKYTTRVLTDALRRFCGTGMQTMVEIGGANSCFLDKIRQQIQPAQYHVVDLNEYGLDLLRKRLQPGEPVFLHLQDCRSVTLPSPADVVFSVGLIEHFSPEETRKAVLAHFDLLRPGGHAIISFPTPTWLYRAARSVCEGLGLWKFPDERPLDPGEVLGTMVENGGTVLYQKTLWPLVFTQHLIVARKNS